MVKLHVYQSPAPCEMSGFANESSSFCDLYHGGSGAYDRPVQHFIFNFRDFVLKDWFGLPYFECPNLPSMPSPMIGCSSPQNSQRIRPKVLICVLYFMIVRSDSVVMDERASDASAPSETANPDGLTTDRSTDRGAESENVTECSVIALPGPNGNNQLPLQVMPRVIPMTLSKHWMLFMIISLSLPPSLWAHCLVLDLLQPDIDKFQRLMDQLSNGNWCLVRLIFVRFKRLVNSVFTCTYGCSHERCASSQ